jgi:hypothetical protein
MVVYLIYKYKLSFSLEQYFEQDDPELYLRKIKFILENDVDSMELTFVEEEYELGKLIKVGRVQTHY